ncbi:acetyl esterase [Mycolicibacterium rutilum]|uniref:Acetyl esterase n=1 Tax=Mycolicibacterium rutilum TaxID=370526 RepID=A0A1H6LK08_MYCRU|nr:alpha/beta hydrolase [Mycolicibacterium rutilum]SEH86618.1 acetyl esterase [Mycolicibacterium rutilum]
MTQSLPAREAWSPGRREALVNAAAGVTLRTLPRIPDAVKRLLLGGRSVTIDGNTLDTTLQLLLAGQKLVGIDGLSGPDDVIAARAQLRGLSAGFDSFIPVAAVTDLSVAGGIGPIPARHYATAAPDAPLLVFFHGGGFVLGDLDSHDDLCRLICRDAAVHVLAVDYRLAPEHKAPAAADDGFAAYQWALEHAAELGADPGRVAVGGDSAGGNIAAVVAQRARNESLPTPALQLLIYPWTNLSGHTRSQTLFARGYFLTKADLEWFCDKYVAGATVAVTDPVVSPALADDLSGLAPALVLTGGFDPLRDEGNRYAEALRAAGVPVDFRPAGSLIHGFASMFAVGGGSATAVADMISALRAHLARV